MPVCYLISLAIRSLGRAQQMVTLLPYTLFVPHLIFFLKFLLLYLQLYQFTIFNSFIIFFYFRVCLQTKFSCICFILMNRLNISLFNELYNTEPLKIIDNSLICTYTASFKITKWDCS